MVVLILKRVLFATSICALFAFKPVPRDTRIFAPVIAWNSNCCRLETIWELGFAYKGTVRGSWPSGKVLVLHFSIELRDRNGEFLARDWICSGCVPFVPNRFSCSERNTWFTFGDGGSCSSAPLYRKSRIWVAGHSSNYIAVHLVKTAL